MSSTFRKYQPQSSKPTQTLDLYSTDLTQKACKGQLPDIIGRDEEINLVIECLCRRLKIFPILVGPAGIGKNAIVEGLSLKVVSGEVPEKLKNLRILALNPHSLLPGSHQEDDYDQLIDDILEEANQDGIVLFIDDAHFIYGKSGSTWSKVITEKLNSAIVNGNLKCISGVTFEMHHFLNDKPQDKHFQPLRVSEISANETMTILSSLGDVIEQEQGVHIDDEIYPWLVDFANKYIRNRYFPEKAIDLLDQCVSYVITNNRQNVTLTDVIFIAERLIGFPFDLTTKINDLSTLLSKLSLLNTEDTEKLIDRLNITIRGLDIHPYRPNLVIMLADKSAKINQILASIIAKTLFGDRERVVTIDPKLLSHEDGLLWFLGYKSEFEGFRQVSPIYKIAQKPWSVISIEKLDDYHPSVVDSIVHSLEKGYLNDMSGKRIFLSDAIVILTINTDQNNKHRYGFDIIDNLSMDKYIQEIEARFGHKLLEQIDLICNDIPDSMKTRKILLEDHFLVNLTERYALEDLNLLWDQSFIDWLLNRTEEIPHQKDLDRLAEEQLSPLLIQYLSHSKGEKEYPLLVSYGQDRIRVKPVDHQDDES